MGEGKGSKWKRPSHMDSVLLDLFFWHRRSLVRPRHHGKLRESRQATRQNCAVDKTAHRINSRRKGSRRRCMYKVLGAKRAEKAGTHNKFNKPSHSPRHPHQSTSHSLEWLHATSHTPVSYGALECSTGSTLGRADPEDDSVQNACGPISSRCSACKGSPSPMSWFMPR